MNDTGSPFDDIRRLLAELPGPEAVGDLHGAATKGLGRLHELAEWLAVWQGRVVPSVQRPRVAIFASSHGVAARVAAEPSTNRIVERMAACAAGSAAINRLCTTFDIGLKVFNLAVDIPTGDIADAPAMDEKMCAATMAFGMEATEGDVDLLCLGELGLGIGTVAGAIFHALWGGRPGDWADGLYGPDDDSARVAAVISAAVACHRQHLDDPLEVLRRVGGRDIAAIAGAIVAARVQRIPVLLDGLAASAGAAILHAIDPAIIDHCRAAHCGGGSAHRQALARLGLAPLLDLGISEGEGTGAVLAVAVAKAAAACREVETEPAL